MKVELTLNGVRRTLEGDARRTVLEVIREDLGLTGTKYGCGEGDCRACTILVDGEAVPSCQLSLSDLKGKVVVTIEGLASDGGLHVAQQAFVDADAMQCGYCVPGMVLTAVGLLERNAKPSDAEIVEALDGNLCRCCGYVNIVNAVRLARDRMASASATEAAARKEAGR